MKEKYYTKDNIDSVADSILAEIDALGYNREFIIDPQKSALIVVDMQNYFLDRSSHAFIASAEAILPRIKEMQDCFFENNAPVYHTRHVNTAENAGSMDKWWSDLIVEGESAQIVQDLRDNRATVIEKPQYDAFLYTDFERQLKSSGITQVVISGVMTHLCCETIARSAFMRGFEVFFTIDGVATYRFDFHKASVLALAHGFANILKSCRIMEVMNDGQ